MKKILCYGDSNTFGFDSSTGSRFDDKTRWTAVLQANLGDDYKIIEEGGCGRTGFVDNPEGVSFSAQMHFPSVLSEVDNVDILILAIGTNDLQSQYDISFSVIEKGLENLIKIAQGKVNQIIIIPPVVLSEKIFDGYFRYQFDETSIIKSKKIAPIYERIANMYNCKYIDINNFVKPSDIDGLHYDKISHKIIADKLSEYILSFVSDDKISV